MSAHGLARRLVYNPDIRVRDIAKEITLRQRVEIDFDRHFSGVRNKNNRLPLKVVAEALETWRMCNGNTPAASALTGVKEGTLNKWVSEHLLPVKLTDSSTILILKSKV
ncbi:hypothetical protein HDC90_001142 [Pedobacter sp. AK013]|nr:hypothetical protein [Pedobacter sp. AK013]